MAGVDQESWESEQDRPVKAWPGPGAQYAPIGVAGRRQPGDQRDKIGGERQRQANKEIGRRIEEGGVAVRRAEQRLLRRQVRVLVVGAGRVAVEGQIGGGPKADEIGAERLAGEIDAAARRDDPDQRQDDARRKQQSWIDARAPAVQPVGVAQRRPDRLHRPVHRRQARGQGLMRR